MTESAAPRTPGPLGPLAISLSGGGYRAAAFHLGMLKLLHRAGLLEDVVGLSTVSGGTLVGMSWVVSQLDGESFPDFHTRFSGWMQRTNVIALALDGLAQRRSGMRNSWPSLIRGAAEVYDRPDLLNGRRFGEVLHARGLPLRQIIFNSTEFHTGVDFRFRAAESPLARIGNGNYRVPRRVAEHLRLADIAAASSCFPGGFEPIVFPQHFAWPAEFPLADALRELGPSYKSGLPLMDGGIYDNQGIDALVLALKRSEAETLLISDVAAKQKDIYNVPPPSHSRGYLTLEWVSRLGWVLLLLALVSAVLLGMDAVRALRDGTWRWTEAFVYLFPGLLSAGVVTALVWLRRRLRTGEALAEKELNVDVWGAVRRLTVPEVQEMVTLRVGSLLALTSSIFMKRVRSLVYKGVYQDEKYKGRRMANLIYSLGEDVPKLFAAHPWLKPSAELVTLSDTVSAMGTTLWFDQHVRFEPLDRAGQATACFILLRHIVEDRPGYDFPGTPLNALFERLRGMWMEYNGPVAATARPVPAAIGVTATV
ncbi:MAG TPA: patatin-like phospholipase family protein [Longimicrobium sp.]|jgi:predicted acylesterase/phospholipase RssA|uniref:patatin-like phospholipase family protein n=1 Tax=Longimicrobium sp. TaxID=2029185 RepID=UPI002ED88E18